MQNENLKFKIIRGLNSFLNGKKEIAKIDSEIYSTRKGSDSPGSFGFKRTGGKN